MDQRGMFRDPSIFFFFGRGQLDKMDVGHDERLPVS